jgi:Tol biopolymer transport system component
MLRCAVLAALALAAAGCGVAEKAATDGPIERHLVYRSVIGDKGIWIADVDGGNSRPLGVRGYQPTISPDGKWVTYFGRCDPGDTSACGTLYVVASSGDDEPRRLSTIVSGVVWSPDSKWIVARSRFKLLRIEISSGKADEVAVGQFAGWSISPDGEQVVFAREAKPEGDLVSGFDVDLFVNDLDGGEPKRITETHDATDPVWGPKAIAFSKLISCLPSSEDDPPIEGCKNNTWGRHELWAVQPDGSELRPIAAPLPDRFQMQGCVGVRPVEWSDDGSRLLAVWRCEFSEDPIAVDVADGKMRELGPGIAVSLSDDARFALVDGSVGAEPTFGTQEVLIYPFGGGKPDIAARRASDPSWNR